MNCQQHSISWYGLLNIIHFYFGSFKNVPMTWISLCLFRDGGKQLNLLFDVSSCVSDDQKVVKKYAWNLRSSQTFSSIDLNVYNMTFWPEDKQFLKLLRVTLWLADYLCGFIEQECKSAKAKGLSSQASLCAGLLKCVGVGSPFYFWGLWSITLFVLFLLNVNFSIVPHK